MGGPAARHRTGPDHPLSRRAQDPSSRSSFLTSRPDYQDVGRMRAIAHMPKSRRPACIGICHKSDAKRGRAHVFEAVTDRPISAALPVLGGVPRRAHTLGTVGRLRGVWIARPVRTFRVKNVDFCGMTSPASATSRTCATGVPFIGKRHWPLLLRRSARRRRLRVPDVRFCGLHLRRDSGRARGCPCGGAPRPSSAARGPSRRARRAPRGRRPSFSAREGPARHPRRARATRSSSRAPATYTSALAPGGSSPSRPNRLDAPASALTVVEARGE